jgi:hypothetical protein
MGNEPLNALAPKYTQTQDERQGIVILFHGFPLPVVAGSFSGMGLDGYASGIIGRASWFISFSL